MATLQGGLTFEGDPNEIVLVSTQSIMDAIPDEAAEWRDYIDRVYGHSQPANYMYKWQLMDYSLNAWARLNLPQWTWVGTTILEAAHIFLLRDDLRPDNKLAPDAVLGFWTVTAQALAATETTNEADPCYQHYKSETGSYSYFGWTPVVHRAVPYPAPCKQQFEIFEVGQRRPGANALTNNDAFQYRFSDGVNSVTFVKGGGITVELTTLEVTESGAWYVSLPQLPNNVPYPPPLVGRVVDEGPPGPAGPIGPPGVQGPPGETPSGESMVDAICSLTEPQKDDVVACLAIAPAPVSYLDLVAGAGVEEVKTAQQIILNEAPEVVIPDVTIQLIEEGEASFEAVPLPGGGWKLALLLPIAGLLALKAILQEVSVFDCGENGEPSTKQISFPVLSIGDNTQKDLWQELFKQLSYLMQCCKPCESYDWQLWRTEKGNGAHFPEYDFKAVRLVAVENPNPEVNAWYGDFTIRKFGIMRWLFAVEEHSTGGGGAASDTSLMFWNTNDQIFVKPPGAVTGFEILQEWAKEFQIWLLPVELTASGIKL